MALQLDIENLALVQNEDRLGKLILAIVAALVARGWTVEGSGDGISTVQNRTQTAGPYNVFTTGVGYRTGGGVWNGTLGGVGTISNSRAWIIVKEPAPSTRAFLFQRSSGTTTGFECYLNVLLSYAGFATSGATFQAPPAVASGTIQVVLTGSTVNGGGADFFINAAGTVIAGSNTLIANLLVSDVVKGGNSWPFILHGYNSTLATRTWGAIYESFSETPTDADPVMCLFGTHAAVFGTPNTTPTMLYAGRRDDGTAVLTLGVMYPTMTGFGASPATAPQANADGKLRPIPVFVGNAVAGGGHYKGRADHLQFNYQARNYPSTLNVATASPYLYAGVYMIPWKTSTTPGT